MLDALFLVLVFPLVGFAYCVLRGAVQTARRSDPARGNLDAGIVASAVVGAAFVVVLLALIQLGGLPADRRFREVALWSWITSGDLGVGFSLLVDPLSVLMAAIVTGVAFLIHVYAVGYMRGERGFVRFFAYLNLFVLAMLILVLAGNFPTLMVGWGGVGLASYLLIAYRFEQPEAAAAAIKAFVVNAIGDVGLLLATVLVFTTFGTVAFDAVFRSATGGNPAPVATVTAIALLLLVAAIAKSGQFPLHVWLPDAMVAPAPVSALIHAATMVTAGVYLIVRMHPIFAQAPAAMAAVAAVGAISAIFAATIGLVQPNVKRVLAYSTISQLGYMFIAAGVGAFGAAIFHLMTHAFYKAALFLGAGAAGHALDGEENLFRLGGLARRLPVAYAAFLAGALALAGVPVFSGFWSKDAILGAAFGTGHTLVGAVALATVVLTGLYAARALLLAFHGAPTWQAHHGDHLHLPGLAMAAPLAVLGLLSVVGGWFAVDGFLAPTFARYPVRVEHAEAGLGLTIAAVILAAAGIAMGGWLYARDRALPGRLTAQLRGAYDLLLNRYYVDQIYGAAIVAPLRTIAGFVGHVFDPGAIDGIVRGVGQDVGALAALFSRWQTGYVRSYAMAVAAGAVVLVTYLLASGGAR